MDRKPLIVLLFGPPGCGKGTQAAFLADRFRIPAVSTGEMFRAEAWAGTRLGRLACSILSSGRLVPDEVVNRMIGEVLGRPDCRRGFLLDGYPRSVPQAEFLKLWLERRGLPAPVLVHLDVAAAKLVRRLAARRQCPVCRAIYNLESQPPRAPGICDADGAELSRREDDTEEVIRARLDAYAELTGPVIRCFASCQYHRVDGALPPAMVSSRIESVLEEMAPAGV